MLTPKQVANQWLAAFNTRNVAAATLLYHEDAINLQVPMGQPVRGREAIIDALVHLFRAFPDSRAEVESMFEDGEWAIIEWILAGTFRGEFAGHAPTGRSFVLQGCEFFHVTQGKIRQQRGYWDKSTWFNQLALRID
jgi:steroid delta-isomerase-like uncharacterized protein